MSNDNKTDKNLSSNDASQVLGYVFSADDNTLATGSFVAGYPGRKVSRSDTSGGNLNGAAAGDDFLYSESGDDLYILRVLYSDLAKVLFLSVERIEV